MSSHRREGQENAAPQISHTDGFPEEQADHLEDDEGESRLHSEENYVEGALRPDWREVY